MMHFMLETMLMGQLMGVDPFDQPGVEEGKVLARQYLGGQVASPVIPGVREAAASREGRGSSFRYRSAV